MTFRSLVFSVLCLLPLPLTASNDQDDWSMGPVGGKFRVQPGTPYLKVQSVAAGAPGATAGLLVGDYIYGAFGQSLGVTLTNSATGGYKGAAQDFGNAIERAESGNGSLPLTVLRPGTGSLALTVALTASGGFGPAYPLGSTKFNTMYDWSAGQIHSLVTASSTGSFGYDTGWFGVILLAHPNWNDSSGSKPYRTSINKLRDRCSAWLNTLELTPLEATLMDGVTPTPGYVAPSSLETWDISASSMFLAAYRLKTGDTSVDAIVQRAADMLANRIQDWQQPMYNGTTGPTKVGLMGHGGVEGDYPHIGYSGINIVNAHAMTAMALLKTAGATVNADKFNKSYTWMLGCMTSDGGSEDGNVGYAWKQGGYDSTGRTAGLVFAMENWGGMDATQTSNVARMKSYLVRQWQRHQVCHAYTVGGVTLYQFALPYFADREQRFLMENLKHFYQFHRNAGGTLDYFGGRGNNGGDDYLDLNRVKLINVGIAQAIASGNLPGFPAPSPSRIHASFNSPWLTWPTLTARYATITGTSANFNVDITNYLGTVLNTGDYTASWSHISTPGTYVLRLTASDTAITTYDEVTLTLTAASTVSVMATDAAAAETGPDSGTFTFTRSGSLSGALTVNFTLSGSATNGTDYATLATPISIPDGAATVTLEVTPLADVLAEGPETVVLTLASGAYSYDTTPATVTLGDTPHAPVWSASPISTGDAVMNIAYTGQALTAFGTDPDGPFGDTLTFTKVSGPSWLGVASNGTLSGTPLQADLGTNTFVVRTTDATGLFAETTLVILVRSNIKADNTDSLHLGTSWVGALAPSTSDVATWYGIYNTAGSLAAVLPGSALTWKGIAIGNLTGTAAGLVSIGGTGSATASSSLALGTSGIDMSTANQNLVINSITTVFNGSQTWTVASGRNLRFGTTGTTGPNANLDGAAATVITVQGGGVIDLNQGSGSGSGLAGFSGKWIVNTGTTLRGLRNTTEAWGTNTASDTITLSGGVLAVGGILSTQGNWTWNSNIFLTMDTTSAMDQQIYTGTGRSLKLNGVFSGGGNLIFKETGSTNSFDNDDLGFILTGTNTLTGTLTIGGATQNGLTGRLSSVRVGGLGGTSTDTSAGTTGTLGTATVVNHGVLTLSHSNTWTFANAMSGAGKLRVGGAMTNSSSQDVTVSGANSYAGGTDLANGILRVSSNNTALGTGTVSVTGNATLATASGGGARTLANPITVNASVTATLNSSFATLTLDGLIGGTGNVAIAGTGTTILTAVNSYAGTTTVGAGTTLRVNGNHSGTGAVTVVGTLEGSGTLPGPISVSGTLAPGDGVGTLSTGACTLASASRISWQAADWAGTAGTGHDCLVATSLNLTGATSIIVVVSEKSLTNFSNQAKTFPLVQTTGGVTGFSAGQFSVDATAFPTATGTWSVQLAVGGNNLLLAYSPPNSAPSFLADPIDGGSAAAAVAFTGSIAARATDPNAGDSLTFTKVSGPNWLIVASNGGLSGVPAVTDLGSNAFTVRVTDAGSLAATAGLTITVTGTPQQQWQSTTFGANASNPLVAGDHADPDFDGIENLIEYALALNPKLSSSLAAALVPDIEVVDGGKFLRLAVTKNPNATDLVFTVEVSADMFQWRTDQTFIETQSSTILKTRDTVPLGSATKRFIRLRVVRP